MTNWMENLPSFSSFLSAYASISTTLILIRTVFHEIIPERIQSYISSKFSYFISTYFSSDFTFYVEDSWQASNNELYGSVEVYLPTRIGPSCESLMVGNDDPDDPVVPPKRSIAENCKIVDDFEGMRLNWTFYTIERKYRSTKRYYSLICKKRDRERVEQRYFPYIIKTAQEIVQNTENLSIYTYDKEDSTWEPTVFKHPATFETLAMEPELKQFIINDLDSFAKRKKFFEKAGRAWKRGYLLHGPPGTGKSSLVGAIANHMRYDIYDLQLQSVENDYELRRILTRTVNRSILLIEDIDCNTNVSHDRDNIKQEVEEEEKKKPPAPGVTLSGLLNFIDGLWSICSNEKIIIFTTNHKEKLDPALLRPGRMDMHIYMGYCSPAGFRKLAETYLGIKDDKLFEYIDDLITKVEVTPAEVAQQLMISDETKAVLQGLVEFLNTKKKKTKDKTEEPDEAEDKVDDMKKNKIEETDDGALRRRKTRKRKKRWFKSKNGRRD